MKPLNPPHPYCWVHTKWGRHKARALIEYIQVGGIHHGQIYVQVEMQNPTFSKEDKIQVFDYEHIEYIKE